MFDNVQSCMNESVLLRFLYVNRYDNLISLMTMKANKTCVFGLFSFFLFIHIFMEYDHAEMLPFGG